MRFDTASVVVPGQVLANSRQVGRPLSLVILDPPSDGLPPGEVAGSGVGAVFRCPLPQQTLMVSEGSPMTRCRLLGEKRKAPLRLRLPRRASPRPRVPTWLYHPELGPSPASPDHPWISANSRWRVIARRPALAEPRRWGRLSACRPGRNSIVTFAEFIRPCGRRGKQQLNCYPGATSG